MGAWEGVITNSQKYHSSPPCPNILRPVGGQPLKQPFQGGLHPSFTLLDTPRLTPMFLTLVDVCGVDDGDADDDDGQKPEARFSCFFRLHFLPDFKRKSNLYRVDQNFLDLGI
jgi:hypothetical protein